MSDKLPDPRPSPGYDFDPEKVVTNPGYLKNPVVQQSAHAAVKATNKRVRRTEMLAAGSTFGAVAALVMQLAGMVRDDRREAREAERMEREAQASRDERRELQQLRWRLLQGTAQPWATPAPDGGVR